MRPMPELKVETVPTNELLEYRNNAKLHPSEQVDQIAASIEEFGFNSPILAWHNDDGEPEVIAGHGRLMAARKLGMEKLPVVFLDHMTEQQRRAYILVDNQLTMNSGFDFGILQSELAEISDIDMTDFDFYVAPQDIGEPYIEDVHQKNEWREEGRGGYDDSSRNNDGLEPNRDVEEVEIPDNAEPRVKLGDVWKLGNHMLMCGDSTNQDNVDMLMNGVRAELLFTSPPYADMRTYNGDKELSTELLARFIPAYVSFCEYQAVNLGIKRKDHEIVPYWDDYIASAHSAGLKLMAWNVWDKGECGNVASQSNIVPIRHEFIFVFGTEDKPLNKTWEKKTGAVDHEVRTTRRQADGSLKVSSKGDMSSPYKEMESVLLCTPVKGNYGENAHPAPFPVGLPTEYIKAFTDEGDVVAEPFGGSGTTLIACEQLGRECRCMELDPRYCDIIIERWEGLTGGKAERLVV